MTLCPVCNSIHRRGIEEIAKSPHGITRTAFFYDIDPIALENHLKYHMESIS